MKITNLKSKSGSIANQFESFEEVMAGAVIGDELLTPNLCKKLLASADYAAIAPKLVSCATDIALPEMSIDLPTKPKSMEKINLLKEQYGLGTSIDRIVSALGWI